MPRKQLKYSIDQSSVRDKTPCSSSTRTTRTQSSLLDSLPPEILEKIFYYLNPLDLVSVGNLGNQRITEISMTMKHADFSRCNTIDAKDVLAFFTKDRVLHIQEMNFSNVFLVNSCTLEKCIRRCKRLKKLYVYDCGLAYKSILSIIESCEELEELYCTMWESKINECGMKNLKPIKLKKFYCNFRRRFTFQNIARFYDILNQCGSSREFCADMSPYFIVTLPPCLGKKIFLSHLNHTVGTFFCHIYGDRGLNYRCAVPTTICMNNLAAVPSFANKLMEYSTGVEVLSLFLSDYAYLQVYTRVDHLDALSSFPANSVSKFVLIMTDEKLCLQNYIERLKLITGEKLELFAVNTPENSSTPLANEQGVLEERMQYELLTQMTSTCLNIQVLNICELHFNEPFCFESLCHLKQLRTLSLPACILRKPADSTLERDSVVMEVGFEDFVLQCEKVEVFSFYGCHNCNFGPKDVDFMAVAKWPRLSHLMISKVRTFRVCNFLLHVADSCPRFRSLEIVDISFSVCHFIPSVVHVLRTSKQLKFLRINQKTFNPVNTLFWKSVALAQNLQGLCLTFEVSTVVENKMITDAFKKLPYFNLFHLHGERTCMNLYSHVMRIMKSKDVKYPRVEIPVYDLAADGIECVAPHFPYLFVN